MGIKVEGIKIKTREGIEQMKQGAEENKKIVEEGRRISQGLGRLPEDIDDDLTRSIREYESSARAEALREIKNNEEQYIKSGQRVVEEASSQGKKIEEATGKAKAELSNLKGDSRFGHGAIEHAKGIADDTIQQINRITEYARQESERISPASMEAERDIQNLLRG